MNPALLGGLLGYNAQSAAQLGNLLGAWQSRVPTVTATTNTITSVTGASGRYIQIGKLVIDQFQFTIATNGTATGVLQCSSALPINMNVAGSGRENSSLGILALWGVQGSSLIQMSTTTNTYPGADARLFFGLLIYETT